MVEAIFVSDLQELPKLASNGMLNWKLKLLTRLSVIRTRPARTSRLKQQHPSHGIAIRSEPQRPRLAWWRLGIYMSSHSNSIKSTPTIPRTMEPTATAGSTTVITAPTAQFLGSFAADSRHDYGKPSAKRDIKSIVQHYFTEGWSDISIWKSAVSANFLSE